jgi:hypothetical protein
MKSILIVDDDTRVLVTIVDLVRSIIEELNKGMYKIMGWLIRLSVVESPDVQWLLFLSLYLIFLIFRGRVLDKFQSSAK